MKVNIGTIEINDDVRRAVAHRFGKKGLATRADVRSLYLSLADADMQTIVDDWEKDVAEKKVAQ